MRVQKIENLKIRKLTLQDEEAFWKLRLEALKNDPQSFAADYEDSKNASREEITRRIEPSDNSFVLGAFTPELIGMLGFYRRQGAKVKHKGNMWGMFVGKPCRGKGVGRAIMTEALSLLRGIDGLEGVALNVVSTKDSARSLYLSMGFKVYGLERRVLKIDGQYFDEELMELSL